MDFMSILKENEVKNNILTLGHNNKNLLELNIKNNPSIIITGETGSGKSILLDQIILELINKYTSLDMSLILIDTSGVELNYYDETKYTTLSAINDLDKSVIILSRVLKEIDRRKEILKNNNCLNVEEYNSKNSIKLPLLVVAIDDDKMLLRTEDVEKMLTAIISQISGLNILFLLATSDVFNKFFKNDSNIYASTLITFDYTNKTESLYANIEGAENLEIGSFIVKMKDNQEKYHNFEFKDEYIKEVLSK